MKAGIIIQKIMLIITTIIVSFLVIIAIYANKSHFYNPQIIKYKQISIESDQEIFDLADSYNDIKQKDKFISEVKKINNINSFDNISKKIIIIPIVN